MSVGFCVHICQAVDSGAGSKFAGIEGQNCYCFDNLNNDEPLTNRHCRAKCPGEFSQICGGPGAMSVIKLVDDSINEVLLVYGGKDDPGYEIISKDGTVCTASSLPNFPDTDLKWYGWTTRKDRYLIICGGAHTDSSDSKSTTFQLLAHSHIICYYFRARILLYA